MIATATTLPWLKPSEERVTSSSRVGVHTSARSTTEALSQNFRLSPNLLLKTQLRPQDWGDQPLGSSGHGNATALDACANVRRPRGGEDVQILEREGWPRSHRSNPSRRRDER